ncbi:DUF167 domain-containing protein [Rhodopirellula halodulae]|uniref:DUF167 domain-containing protein n=1 Tax=Rhodopirellula halodulae TaxID=2894198 RepID=UPI003F6890AF
MNLAPHMDCDGLLCRFRVRVTPKAKKASVGGVHDGALKVSVHAVPENGKANRAVVASLAKWFGISKSRLAIVSGDTSRQKTVEVQFASDAELQSAMERLRAAAE